MNYYTILAIRSAVLTNPQLADFENAKIKHDKAEDKFIKPKTLLDMWASLATLSHWLSQPQNDAFIRMDDGERCCKLVGLLGSAFVTMLDTIDKENQLRPDGDIKDLGLVMSLFLKFADGLQDYGIEDHDDDPDDPDGGKVLKWRRFTVAFARKGGIDLVATGCAGTGQTLEESYEDVAAEEVKGAAEYVNWTKTVSQHSVPPGYLHDS